MQTIYSFNIFDEENEELILFKNYTTKNACIRGFARYIRKHSEIDLKKYVDLKKYSVDIVKDVMDGNTKSYDVEKNWRVVSFDLNSKKNNIDMITKSINSNNEVESMHISMMTF